RRRARGTRWASLSDSRRHSRSATARGRGAALLLWPGPRRRVSGAGAARRRKSARPHDRQRVSARGTAGHSDTTVHSPDAGARVDDGAPSVAGEKTISFERDRVNALLEQLESMPAGAIETKLPLTPLRDELDAISHGINALADELRYASARAADVERRAAEELLRAKELAEHANDTKS